MVFPCISYLNNHRLQASYPLHLGLKKLAHCAFSPIMVVKNGPKHHHPTRWKMAQNITTLPLPPPPLFCKKNGRDLEPKVHSLTLDSNGIFFCFSVRVGFPKELAKQQLHFCALRGEASVGWLDMLDSIPQLAGKIPLRTTRYSPCLSGG